MFIFLNLDSIVRWSVILIAGIRLFYFIFRCKPCFYCVSLSISMFLVLFVSFSLCLSFSVSLFLSFSCLYSCLIHTVTKPTHLELDNGQVQSHSTNGKNNIHLRLFLDTNKIYWTFFFL